MNHPPASRNKAKQLKKIFAKKLITFFRSASYEKASIPTLYIFYSYCYDITFANQKAMIVHAQSPLLIGF
jgi:hypothetical protein